MLISWAMRLVTASILLAGVLSSSAAESPAPTLRIERTAAGPVTYIHNPGAQPLTAVLLTTDNHPGGDLLFWQDEIREPIPPGADKQIELSNLPAGVTADRVKVQAGLYADGSSTGDPAMVGQSIGQLLQRRGLLLDTARELLRRIEQAQKANTPKATLIGDLKVWADSLQQAPNVPVYGQGPVVQSVARTLILSAIDQLNKRSISDVLVDSMKTESDIDASRPPL
jgi:hypothetical protein